MKTLAAADNAFARVNDSELLGKQSAFTAHHGRHAERAGEHPAPGPLRAGETRTYGPIPALGEHTERIKKEFLS